ncbi:hypothetical protein [Streptomyces sp. NPDC016675]|uniref:hypothetical protein n=1 Tax=Streptomyces sp. NPDC016675 TaxID=3364970 RepID=UPI0036FD6205
MTEKHEDKARIRSCIACGTPAGDGELCEHCGRVLELPAETGLTEDRAAAIRRDFEGRGR